MGRGSHALAAAPPMRAGSHGEGRLSDKSRPPHESRLSSGAGGGGCLTRAAPPHGMCPAS
eukprot:11513469-Karenia_brevis.AAC.1